MLLSALLIAGCTMYHSDPLSTHSTALTANDLGRLRVDPASMPLPELAAHPFDPSNGFDIDEVATLAVVNNPDLKLARADVGIAQAQAFAAGLLPDPQIGVSSDYPGSFGATRAFSYGLNWDVMSLVARNANQKAANAATAKTDLGLLWQEWQVVAQARQLFLRTKLSEETLPILRTQSEISRTRYEHMAAAQHNGNLTSDVLVAALTAYNDARKQYADAQRAATQTHHDLNLLLGLAPDVQLQLAGEGNYTALSDADLSAAVRDLSRRRPDLLALAAGYDSQEAKYRAAILGQFPSLTIGFVRSRDTSNVYTSGFQINLSLPIFNRNRGNIAVEGATRERLKSEYQNRLNLAYADIAHLRADTAILMRQRGQAQAALPEAEQNANSAAAAYAKHDITLAAYADAQTAALTKRFDLATLDESIAEQRVGLQALLGGSIPDSFKYVPSTPSIP
jgi:outer membrane protein TolC